MNQNCILKLDSFKKIILFLDRSLDFPHHNNHAPFTPDLKRDVEVVVTYNKDDLKPKAPLRRRKRKFVPVEKKDEAYWQRVRHSIMLLATVSTVSP